MEDILVKPKANVERTKIIDESVTCGTKVKYLSAAEKRAKKKKHAFIKPNTDAKINGMK